MEQKSLPKQTLGRLPKYLSYLRAQPHGEEDFISSTTIAHDLGIGEGRAILGEQDDHCHVVGVVGGVDGGEGNVSRIGERGARSSSVGTIVSTPSTVPRFSKG